MPVRAEAVQRKCRGSAGAVQRLCTTPDRLTVGLQAVLVMVPLAACMVEQTEQTGVGCGGLWWAVQSMFM